MDFVDVSHHNGEIPWNRFREAGVKGGICKVSDQYFMEPTYRTHIDSQFKRNWQALYTFDLRGAYGFMRWDVGIKTGGLTMRGHVKLMVDTIGDHKENDILVLDEEQPFGEIAHISKLARAHMLEDALKEAEKHWDKEYIWNYSGKWWWNYALPAPHIHPMPYILSFPMWANYFRSGFKFRGVPRGYTYEEVIAHQYKIGTIEGIRIDHNNFLWDWDTYLGITQPIPVPDPVPEPVPDPIPDPIPEPIPEPPPPPEPPPDPIPPTPPTPPKSWLEWLIEFIVSLIRRLKR